MDVPQNPDSILAVVVARLDDLKTSQEQYESRMMKEIQAIREDQRRTHESNVSRGEWLQRNTTVDNKHEALSKDILGVKEYATTAVSELKQENASRRSAITPWIALIISGVAVIWTILGPNGDDANGTDSDNSGVTVEQS